MIACQFYAFLAVVFVNYQRSDSHVSFLSAVLALSNHYHHLYRYKGQYHHWIKKGSRGHARAYAQIGVSMLQDL